MDVIVCHTGSTSISHSILVPQTPAVVMTVGAIESPMPIRALEISSMGTNRKKLGNMNRHICTDISSTLVSYVNILNMYPQTGSRITL